MTQRTIDEMRRRSGFDGWRYYLLLACGALATGLVAYLTLHNGLTALLRGDGWMLLSLAICMVALIALWQGRPRKKPNSEIRLNL